MDAPATRLGDNTYFVFAARSLDGLWTGIIRTATYGWTVPDGVIRDSLQPGGRACMPGSCQGGLFHHWVECADDCRRQVTEGGRPVDTCRRRRDCPLYLDGEACDGEVVACQPSVSDMGAWLVWSLVLQVHRDLGGALRTSNPAVRRGLPHTYRIPRYWHLDDPISLVAEVVRRQIACEGLLDFAAPVISDDNRSVTLRAWPTRAFLDALDDIRNGSSPDLACADPQAGETAEKKDSLVMRLVRALAERRRTADDVGGEAIPGRTLAALLVMASLFALVLLVLELRM